MVNLKKLLTKLCGRVNYRTVIVSPENATKIAAGKTAWITVPRPASGTAIGIAGYYITGTSGTTTANIYCIRLASGGYVDMAVYNPASAEASIKPEVTYLVVD